jgi:DNA-binding protein H-NS
MTYGPSASKSSKEHARQSPASAGLSYFDSEVGHAEKREMATLASKSGFSVAELFGKARGVAIKYRNPQNASETWTGRGRRPLWLAKPVVT